MAGFKKKRKRNLTREQSLKIWDHISIQGWQELLQTHRPAHYFTALGPDLLRGLCLSKEHAETHPSFFIHTTKRYAKCFGCNYYTSNPITLAALILETSEAEALQLLQDKFGLPFLSVKVLAELEEQKINQMVKKAIYAAAHEVLCAALWDIEKYPFATEAVNWLTITRGIPKDTIHALPVGILPPLTQLLEIVDTRYRKMLVEWEQNPRGHKPVNLASHVSTYMGEVYNTAKYNGSIIWPIHVSPSEIGRLKLRVPKVAEDKDIYIIQDDFENLLGLYGLGWKPYSETLSASHKPEMVYVTEGEMDVMTHMARAVQNGKTQFMLVSAGGIGGAPYVENILTSSGAEEIGFIGDSPIKGEEGSSARVLRTWLDNIKTLHARIFIGWDKLPLAEDLDAAVRHYGIEKVNEVLYTNKEETFVPAAAWAIEEATPILDSIGDTDFRLMVEKAAASGGFLHNENDLKYYIQQICASYPINEAALRTELSKTEDNEMGFILKCASALRERLFVIGTKVNAGNRWLTLFDKKTKRLLDVKIDSEQSLVQELAPITGTPRNFVKDSVGFPGFMPDPTLTDEPMAYRKTDAQLRFYLKEAIQTMTVNVPDYNAASICSQGYHYIILPNQSVLEYLVCGTDVFEFMRTDKDLKFRKLEGPSDKGIIFEVVMDGKPAPSWYPNGLTTDVLDQGKNYDIKELFEKARTLYDECFVFTNQNVTPMLLAAQLLLFPIMDALDSVQLMFVTGVSHSGKSTVISTFGEKLPEFRMLYCSQYWTSYSKAGILAKMQNNTQTLVLDEFEGDSFTKQNRVQELFELIRGVGETRQGANQVLGTSDGKSRSATLRCSIVLSAITGPLKVQDNNRVLFVELRKVDGRKDSRVILHEKFGIGYVPDIARKLATAMFPHVPEILRIAREIQYDELPKYQTSLPIQLDGRHCSILYGTLALLKYLGYDWKSWLYNYVLENQYRIQETSQNDESEIYLGAMLRNPDVMLPEPRMRTSLAAMLANPDMRKQVNSSGTGIYYDDTGKYLIVLVEQAAGKLVPEALRKGGLPPQRLKELLQRHPTAMSNEEMVERKLLTKYTAYTGANLKPKDVVVLMASPWLGENEDDPPKKTPPVLDNPTPSGVSSEPDGESSGTETVDHSKDWN